MGKRGYASIRFEPCPPFNPLYFEHKTGAALITIGLLLQLLRNWTRRNRRKKRACLDGSSANDLQCLTYYKFSSYLETDFSLKLICSHSNLIQIFIMVDTDLEQYKELYSMKPVSLAFLIRTVIAIFILNIPAVAQEMEFQGGGNDVRCGNCAFIQATGEITSNTPAKFRQVMGKYPKNIYGSLRVRLNSPGGDLRSAIELGQLFRENGITTEVGSDILDSDPDAHSAFGDGRTSIRTGGECASACAYAFMGGIEREVVNGSRIGLHRFFRMDAIKNPTLPLFTGQDLAEEQRITSGLVLYAMQMGVSPEAVVIASDAGPSEMRWVHSVEAHALKLSYTPNEWQPWHIQTYKSGVIAISETTDSKNRMIASCTKKTGARVALIDYSDDVAGTLGWFEQNRTCPSKGYHPVLGANVTPDDVLVSKTSDGGVKIEFLLRKQRLLLERPAIFSRSLSDAYPNACSTDFYNGSTDNFKAAVSIAFKNCIE